MTVTEVAALAFRAPVLALECGQCGEASIAWDRNGTLLVTDAGGRDFARSADDGRTWTPFELGHAQPLPQVANIQSDGQLQVSPDGRIWFSVLRISPTGGGVHILSTSDGGLSWDTDAWVETNLNPVVNAPDRQWLGFSDDGVLLFCVCTAAAVPAIFDSPDGRQFGFREAVAPPGTRNTPWGMPAVFPGGRVVWPYFSADCRTQGAQGLGVMAATQAELGWTASAVKEPGGPVIIPCGFPNAARNETHVAVVWNQLVEAEGRSMMSFSDGGDWSEPLVLPEFEAGYPQPWIESLGEDRWAMLSYEAGQAPKDVLLSVWTDSGLVGSATVGSSKGSTDLPHFAVGPDGRLAVVWADETGIQVAIQSEAS